MKARHIHEGLKHRVQVGGPDFATRLKGFYRVAFRKKICESLEALQEDLDRYPSARGARVED